MGTSLASSVSIGDKHTCAILEDRTVLCWGSASSGRLGYGNLNTIGDNEFPNSAGTVQGLSLDGIKYDEQDRLLSFGTKSFTYNANGDLLTESDSSTGINKTFEYDVFGNLKKIILPGKTINYKVDAHNRRVAKLEGTTVVEYYIWNEKSQLVGVADSSGALLSRFVYGSKAHSPDYMIKNGVTYQLVTNHLGSPVAVIESSTGNIVQEINYDEFGTILSDSNPGFLQIGFAGCLYDQDTMLCKFGARDYNSIIGRWISKDPILFAGRDTNLYGYVLQDPLNWIDPSGLVLRDADGLIAKFLESPFGKNPEVLRVLNELQQSKTLISVHDSIIPEQRIFGKTYKFNDQISVSVDFDKHNGSEGVWNTIYHELLHARNAIRKNGAYDEKTVRNETFRVIGSDCF